jgi:hypothetical protein
MTPEQQEIERLKAQIERLQSGKKRASEFSVREDTYKGYSILVFEGPSLIKPFTVGVGKLQAIRACWHRVEEFLDKNKNKTPDQIENI